MILNDFEFAAIDFESSGFGADGKDEPIQIGIATMRNGEISAADQLRSYIQPHPPRPISHAARAVHRISERDLEGAPDMLSLWPTIRGHLRDRLVVAHGAGTEKRFLRAFPLHGFTNWIDTLQLARRVFPALGDYSLGSLAERAGLPSEIDAVCPEFSWHDALYDAVASLVLLRHIVVEAKIADLSTIVA